MISPRSGRVPVPVPVPQTNGEAADSELESSIAKLKAMSADIESALAPATMLSSLSGRSLTTGQSPPPAAGPPKAESPVGVSYFHEACSNPHWLRTRTRPQRP